MTLVRVVAGPGPTTLAHRLQHGLRRTSTNLSIANSSHAPSPPRIRSRSSSSLKEAPAPRKHAAHPPGVKARRDSAPQRKLQTSSGSQPDSERVKPVPAPVVQDITTRKVIPSRKVGGPLLHPIAVGDPSEEVILLPAPVEHRNVAPLLEDLSQACQTGDLNRALTAWAHLDDYRSTDQAQAEHIDAVSQLVAESCRIGVDGPISFNIGVTARQDPERFGRLVQMAAEAAARDHWYGLYRLMLALLSSGRPSDAIPAFDRHESVKWEVQGKKREDLVSWDREKRLAARLEGKGSTPLAAVKIAALTMTKQLNSENILGLLHSGADYRNIPDLVYKDLRRALWTLSNREQFFTEFDTNYRKVLLAMMSYHPPALIERIRTLTVSHRARPVDWLYGLLLAATLGPDRYIRPLDLDEIFVWDRTQHFDVGLVPDIWGRLLSPLHFPIC
jgi:hypothetical protein